ncbi:F420-dependent NADP oxidoreductase family protein (plasmid) [Halobacterium hubeiense]|uniref:F420-dependent NADP oxidoreductase family protein n=1 Tax=Halobacterium hubeiense TaxID=1407499 RepID=A0A0U5H6D8_9EURY|nr:NAD(P)-binding domain-containing protein [Halobacterium hubeiense]CQH64475.1 F420-dependent NADP oxidoreductase family protein [Halobacterium hubeiense]
MKIGMIGAGDIGSTAAQHFADAGHEVMISNSRGPETLTDLVDELGNNAHAGTVSEAADFGEVVMEAIPFNAYESLPADTLSDKIVISASNYYPMRDGFIDIGETHTDLIADHLEDSRVVKAFNATYWKTLRDGQRSDADPDDRLAIFIAGDDDEAKSVVSNLIEDIGFTPVDTGPLTEGGRFIQPGSPIYTASLSASEARTRLAALKTTVAAYELGYYDTSREVTIQELVDELDMNEETISEHLQQGTEQFISQYLD